jgi:flagellar motor switch protein FliM
MAEESLSQNEMDTLLTGLSSSMVEPPFVFNEADIVKYDPLKQRYMAQKLPTLEMINDSFTRLARITLYNFLKRSANISTGTIRVIEYGEFLQSVINPSCLNLVQLKPLNGIGLCVFDPDISFLFIDSFFGGDGRFETGGIAREFTSTELRTIQRILNLLLLNYQTAWEPYYPIEPLFVRTEMNPTFANIAPQTDLTTVTTFNIEVGNIKGRISFCLPNSLLEPAREIISSDSHTISSDVKSIWYESLKMQMSDAEITTVAELCHIPSTLKKVLDLKIGDVLYTELPHIIDLKVEGLPVIECTYGQKDNRLCIRVEKIIHNFDSFTHLT